MSAMPESKVTDPRDLYVPEVTREQVNHLLEAHLTDESRVAFIQEFVDALYVSKAEGDLVHINRVVEAWTRSAIMVNDTFHQKWERSEQAIHDVDCPTYTLDEIRERLSL